MADHHNNNNKTTFHVVMLPWLAMGHLIPFVHFSNKLAARGHRVSILVPTKTQPKLQPFILYPHLISFVPLEIPQGDGLPLGAETTYDAPPPLIAIAFDQLQPQVQLILQNLNPKPSFIFYDILAYWAPPLSRNVGIKYSILFMVVGPTMHGLISHIDHHHYNKNHVLTDDHHDHDQEELLISGYPPQDHDHPCISSIRIPRFHLRVTLEAFRSQFGLDITFFDRVMRSMRESDTITIRTCREVEGPFCDYIESHIKKPLLLSGPVLPEPPASDRLEQRWAEWLGGFEEGSVVYCTFGSECKFEKNQFQELLSGLELTGLPFLAVLKPPIGAETTEEALPDGFIERVGVRGVVHGGWIPQHLILKHPSVGCFVNHCGYGTLWESLVSNCQIVLVPYALADQYCNAQLMSQVLKVGVEVERREEDGWFSRESVSKAVKLVMDEESPLSNDLKANHDKWKEILLRDGFESSYNDSFLLNLEKLLAV